MKYILSGSMNYDKFYFNWNGLLNWSNSFSNFFDRRILCSVVWINVFIFIFGSWLIFVPKW